MSWVCRVVTRTGRLVHLSDEPVCRWDGKADRWEGRTFCSRAVWSVLQPFALDDRPADHRPVDCPACVARASYYRKRLLDLVAGEPDG